jgi:hypothetical protein
LLASSGAATGHTFNLPGFSGSTEADVNAFVSANNMFSSGAQPSAYVDSGASVTAFTGTGTSCPTP